MNNFVIFDKFGKFGRRCMLESFPDLLLRVQAVCQTFSEILVQRPTHGGTRSISLPRWYIKTFKMQNFEQKLSFFRLVSKIHMGHVTNLTIIIFNQLLVQICIFGKNLKLIALFFPKLRTILIISSNFKNSVGALQWRALQNLCSGSRPFTKHF